MVVVESLVVFIVNLAGDELVVDIVLVGVVLLKDGSVNGAIVDVARDELVVSEARVDLFVE